MPSKQDFLTPTTYWTAGTHLSSLLVPGFMLPATPTITDLGRYNLGGTLAPELAHLPYLQYLELYGNNITGNIPQELGNLINLISMDLSYNRFQGNIPKSFGNLKSLKFLWLNNNQLTGSIPIVVSTLNLQVFNVSNNHLSEPPVDGNFKSFPMERFENNKFSGPELKGLIPSDCKEEAIFT
ncbi:Somatic embryogenesis receptor kinase 4 [Glycine soja]|uniref:Somatic embryogenesis receptor kinase 4 n=1 Tax=Glycine soja TaxID=3848 RepID=A0A0B2RDH9_GLYSO|nr:Somatic embryogenesis receptor kinase 4 [Glycine soja]